jgi:diketogulonate reductase-like aldo/keto reductase
MRRCLREPGALPAPAPRGAAQGGAPGQGADGDAGPGVPAVQAGASASAAGPGKAPAKERRDWLGRAASLTGLAAWRMAAGRLALAPGAAATAASLAAPLAASMAALPGTARAAGPIATRAIPSSGEAVPRVGLGSWITFNVGDDAQALDRCTAVVQAFFADGGRLIDCSPMYGSSQPTIGHALRTLGRPAALFSAEKVWTGSAGEGPAQMEATRRHWGVARFDLMQVHNLVAWQAHLPHLLQMKADGQLRYVGITTSEGRRHRDIEAVMRSQPIDFVQLTYNPVDREAEQRLLPLARERGIAVLANRPFREGALLRALEGRLLPPWVVEAGCDGWAQAVLKFIVTHPAVTCAIPATRRVDHVRQNLGAARGVMPDAAWRTRLAAHLAAL